MQLQFAKKNWVLLRCFVLFLPPIGKKKYAIWKQGFFFLMQSCRNLHAYQDEMFHYSEWQTFSDLVWQLNRVRVCHTESCENDKPTMRSSWGCLFPVFIPFPYMVPCKGPITQVLYAGYINALIGWSSYLKDSNFTVG